MDINEIRQDLSVKIKALPPLGKKLKLKLDDQVLFIDGTGESNVLIDADDEANTTISMSIETYLKLQRGEIKPMIATLAGKIKVKGDIGLAQELKHLI
jgi:putative sterol carrier protein